MKNRILFLLIFVIVMFAAVASAQDDAAAIEQLKADALAKAEAARIKAGKQPKSVGFLSALAEKRNITIAYVNAVVKDKVKKAEKALTDNDFKTAFELNHNMMALVIAKREILGDEIYKKHKVVISKQYDIIVKTKKDYLGEIKKREITSSYVDLFVNDKVNETKKALADKDFDRAFVLNSEIMLLIHKNRELLGEFYDKHKAVFFSQHDLIVKAEKKHDSVIRPSTEMQRKEAVKQYLSSAYILKKNAQYEEALVLIEKVLLLDPHNDEANMLEGLLEDTIRWQKELKKKQIRVEEKKHEIEKKVIEETERLRRAAELKRKEAVKQYLSSANVLIKNAQYEDALVMIEKVLILEPVNDEAVIQRTHLLNIIRWRKERKFKQQISEEARSAAELERKKAIKQYLSSANILKKNTQYEEALVMVNKVLMLDPDNKEALERERILRDTIFWWKEAKILKEINKLEREILTRKPHSSIPRDEDLTFPDRNDILNNAYNHVLKSRYGKALGLVKMVLMFDPSNDRALALEAYLNDNIRWRKENKKLDYIAVNKQLDSLVDLSAFVQDTTFAEAIDIIRKSVKPELQVTVLWKDIEKASIKRGDAIGICGRGFTKLPLKVGIDRVLQVMGGSVARLDYSVEDGLVTIATKKTLQEKMKKRIGTTSKVKKAADKVE